MTGHQTTYGGRSIELDTQLLRAHGGMLTERELPVFLLDLLRGRLFADVENVVRAAIREFACRVRVRKGTYLSLNAFKMRSTSSSRWKAVASLFKSFSMSRSFAGAEDLDEDGSAMAVAATKPVVGDFYWVCEGERYGSRLSGRQWLNKRRRRAEGAVEKKGRRGTPATMMGVCREGAAAALAP